MNDYYHSEGTTSDSLIGGKANREIPGRWLDTENSENANEAYLGKTDRVIRSAKG